MSPGGHLITTAIACASAYVATGSMGLVGGLAIGGFLIDVDHALDYVAFERQRDLRPSAFLRYYLSGQAERAVLLLHSYELVGLLLAVAWAAGWVWLWGYLVGALLHLALDVVFNGQLAGRSLVPFYSFTYRWRHRFRCDVLLGRPAIRPVGPGFWTTFFLGAVRAGAPVPAPRPIRAMTAAPRTGSADISS
jgi:hypothetical protein